MIELFREWKWDVYHIIAITVIVVVVWRLITLAIESHKINKKKSNGKPKERK
jgi:uncharacterized protein YpmS